MGILTKLFGKDETVDKAVDGVIRGIDALVFTEEEKSQANMKGISLQIEMAKALGPSNIARRVIAISIVGTWLFNIQLGILLVLLDMDAKADFVFEMVKVLGVPVTVILGFYFAKHMASAWAGRKKD